MSKPWNASSAIGVKMYYRSIMEDFKGVKKEWDRIRGEKKDGEDQIDRANPSTPEPNTNQGDAEYSDPCCGLVFSTMDLDEQDEPIILRGQRYVHNPSR